MSEPLTQSFLRENWKLVCKTTWKKSREATSTQSQRSAKTLSSAHRHSMDEMTCTFSNIQRFIKAILAETASFVQKKVSTLN